MTKYQIKELRKLQHEATILRDGEKCLKCGNTKTLCASHIYPKGTHRKMEFDPDNTKTLCYRCHMHWWHKSPIEAWEWIRETLPKERLDRLKLRSQVIDKSIQDYNLLKLQFEQIIKKYN